MIMINIIHSSLHLQHYRHSPPFLLLRRLFFLRECESKRQRLLTEGEVDIATEYRSLSLWEPLTWSCLAWPGPVLYMITFPNLFVCCCWAMCSNQTSNNFVYDHVCCRPSLVIHWHNDVGIWDARKNEGKKTTCIASKYCNCRKDNRFTRKPAKQCKEGHGHGQGKKVKVVKHHVCWLTVLVTWQ